MEAALEAGGSFGFAVSLDEGYRRGTVLGLTMAEVFVLLVFLMMLALMGLNRHWEGIEETVEEWKPIMDKHTPAQVRRALLDPDERREEVERLQEEVERLQEERERLQQRVRTLEGREGTTGPELDEALDRLRELERRNRELAEDLRLMTKGITPPCWYQRVEETNPATAATVREKPYYLFDIAIRSDHVEVQPLPIPEGRAADDDGRPYVEEAEKLSLDALPYGVPLTDEEFRTVMSPLFDSAKAEKVRSYSCIFYVRVWDETALEAKGRWQEAHDLLLEQLFGTHQVRGTPWSERHLVPVNVVVGAE